jgi:hypothetical protein
MIRSAAIFDETTSPSWSSTPVDSMIAASATLNPPESSCGSTESRSATASFTASRILPLISRCTQRRAHGRLRRSTKPSAVYRCHPGRRRRKWPPTRQRPSCHRSRGSLEILEPLFGPIGHHKQPCRSPCLHEAPCGVCGQRSSRSIPHGSVSRTDCPGQPAKGTKVLGEPRTRHVASLNSGREHPEHVEHHMG